jgi:ubiquinone/menaquinone biosynthesis C-methylase UbiE
MSHHDFCATTRFQDRVTAYKKYRPGYPIEVLRFIRNVTRLQKEHTIADIGCGTGIFSEMLLENGNHVIGIEPSASMRNAAEERLDQKYPFTFSTLLATAECTLLESRSIDLITCATAFHWFDIDRTRAEWKRILKPGGNVVLIWNEWHVGASEFMRRYSDFVAQHSSDYNEIKSVVGKHDALVEKLFGDSPTSQASFPNVQVFDRDGLRGRFESSSYAPPIGTKEYDRAIEELNRIFDRCQQNGVVCFVYRTDVYAGTLSCSNIKKQ